MNPTNTGQPNTKSTAAQRTPENAAKPSWPRPLLAPWYALLRPQAAARHLVAARSLAFWATFATHVAILAGLSMFLALWSETVKTNLVPSATTPATTPTTAPGTASAASARLGYLGYNWTTELQTRSLGEVWRDWHRDRLFGPAEWIFLGVAVGVTFGTLFLAWLYLPFIHRSGSGWPSYWRALRAVVAGAGVLISLTAVVGASMVAYNNREQLGQLVPAAEWFAPGLPLACCLVLLAVSRAARGVAPADLSRTIPPMCEGCGYDLTHRPSDGRCSECGLEVTQSLGPQPRRRGLSWERRLALADWVSATWQVLRDPRRFYGRLELRTPMGAAHRSARRHYGWICVGASVWSTLMFVVVSGLYLTSLAELYAIGAVFGMLGLLICWLMHRTVGALVFTWWVIRGLLPDYRWAAKVIYYETAFLWLLCVFAGTLFTSLAVFGAWLADAVGTNLRFIWGVPVEMIVLFAGLAVLAIAWLWRYRVAGQAIRWSNF
ncbi:MAG: hypothetical protein KKB50_08070 [Planctomycetes bacterium]|nr:hypothetical protein [Planctomycetota bacterium]